MSEKRDDSRELANRTVVLLLAVNGEVERLIGYNEDQESYLRGARLALNDAIIALNMYVDNRRDIQF